MSFRVRDLALSSKALPPGQKLVLAAMAHWANDDGTSVYPRLRDVAQRCGLSLRQVQRCVHAMVDHGYLVLEQDCAELGKANRYRIDLERLTGGMTSCHAPPREGMTSVSGGGCQDVTPGVTLLSPPNVTDQEPHQKPVTQTRARAKAGAEGRSAFQPSLMLPIVAKTPEPPDVFAPIWAAIGEAWGELPSTATEERTRKAWTRERARLPEPDELIACIRAFGRKLAAENAARGARLGPVVPVYPHNWLARDDGWKPFLLEIRNAPGRAAEEEARRSHALAGLGADGRAALLQAGLTQAEIESWFAGVRFEPPARFVFTREFARDYVAQKFGARIERALGCEIECVTAAKEQAA